MKIKFLYEEDIETFGALINEAVWHKNLCTYVENTFTMTMNRICWESHHNMQKEYEKLFNDKHVKHPIRAISQIIIKNVYKVEINKKLDKFLQVNHVNMEVAEEHTAKIIFHFNNGKLCCNISSLEILLHNISSEFHSYKR